MEKLTYRMPLPWWVKPLALLLIPVMTVVNIVVWQDGNAFGRFGLFALLYLAALARERDEDERVQQMRLQVLLLTTLTVPIVVVLMSLPELWKQTRDKYHFEGFILLLIGYHFNLWWFKRQANRKAQQTIQTHDEPGA